MKKKHIGFTLALLLIAVACGSKAGQEAEQVLPPVASYEAMGDSTCYGFACDGCSDTAIVFMPDSISDPVSYNIVNAFRRHQVYGNPSVGDQLALYLSSDGKEVLQVVDIDALKGTWVYQVMPEPRMKQEDVPDNLSAKERQELDSVLKALMVPLEYGFTFKRDFTAQPVGGPPRQSSLDEESPVVYPAQQHYREWHLWNGRLILTARTRRSLGEQSDSTQKMQAQVENDTVDLVMLGRDTLVLRFPDYTCNLSRKPDSLMVK